MFLDTGALLDAGEGRSEAVELLKDERQIIMSTISMTEFLEGRIQEGSTSMDEELDHVSGVNWIPYTEAIATTAGRLQLELEKTGERLSQRDLMIAATAVDVGDELIVTDSDFQVPPIENRITVTNLRD
jgi:predicted nucleic acid-binding protein